MVDIPKVEHVVGFWSYWSQPNHEKILVTESFAIMTRDEFNQLHQYDIYNPSGCYIGQMWKSYRKEKYYLYWYDQDSNPNYVKVVKREIIII